MARFDVYANPDRSERDRIPFLLDVQSDHVRGLQTRVVVPLWVSAMLHPRVDDINPEFNVAGLNVVMDTPSLGALPISIFRQPIANLAPCQLSIQNALDALFGGY